MTRKCCHVAVDGSQQGPACGSFGQPVFSRDSVRIAYSAESIPPTERVGGMLPPETLTEYYMVVDGKAWPDFWDLGLPVFSPDSNHIAFPFRKSDPLGMFGTPWYVAVDGTAIQQPFDDVSQPIYSPGSSKLAFVGDSHRGKSLVVQALPTGSPPQVWITVRSLFYPTFITDDDLICFARHEEKETILHNNSPTFLNGLTWRSGVCVLSNHSFRSVWSDEREIFSLEFVI